MRLSIHINNRETAPVERDKTFFKNIFYKRGINRKPKTIFFNRGNFRNAMHMTGYQMPANLIAVFERSLDIHTITYQRFSNLRFRNRLFHNIKRDDVFLNIRHRQTNTGNRDTRPALQSIQQLLRKMNSKHTNIWSIFNTDDLPDGLYNAGKHIS